VQAQFGSAEVPPARLRRTAINVIADRDSSLPLADNVHLFSR
jgi:hypothetical protein